MIYTQIHEIKTPFISTAWIRPVTGSGFLILFCSGVFLFGFLRKWDILFLSSPPLTRLSQNEGDCRTWEGLSMEHPWDDVGMLNLGVYPAREKGGDEGALWKLHSAFVPCSSPPLAIPFKLTFSCAAKCNIYCGPVGIRTLTMNISLRNVFGLSISY